jgi:hypothetical protein
MHFEKCSIATRTRNKCIFLKYPSKIVVLMFQNDTLEEKAVPAKVMGAL